MERAPIIVYNGDLDPVADLHKAVSIGYGLHLNQLGTLTFGLPWDDAHRSEVQGLRYAELWRGDTRVELFRLMGDGRKDQGGLYGSYRASHVLCTLSDDTVEGTQTGTVTEILTAILAEQGTAHWQVGTVDFTDSLTIDFAGETLLYALWALAARLTDWRLTYDTTSYPWTLNLVETDADPVANLRDGINIQSLTTDADYSQLYTRVEPRGAGEGVNQLTIESVHPAGLTYIESSKAGDYDVVRTHPLVDRRFTDAQALYDYAAVWLAEHDTPPTTYRLEIADLPLLTERDEIVPGDYVRVEHEGLGIDADLLVVSVSKRGIKDERLSLVCGKSGLTFASTIAGQGAGLQTEQTHAQGAAWMDTKSVEANADPDNPAVLRFYLLDAVLNVNAVLISYSTLAFRSYAWPQTNSVSPDDPHSHTLTSGIFEAEDEPTAVTLEVDGNTVSGAGTDETDLDITEYLDGYDAGAITRGWHTVTIEPNDLGRIRADIVVKGYSQSTTGGVY